MDYLIVLIMSVMTPFLFSSAETNYSTNFGVFFSDNSVKTKLNTWDVKPIASSKPNSDREVIRYSYAGLYDITYDAFIEYKVPILFNNKLWLAPRFSWQPLREAVNVTLKLPSSTKPAPKSYFYAEMPAVGLVVGYDITSVNEYQFFPYGIAPYIGASFLRIAYSNFTDYERYAIYDSVIKYYGGLRMQINPNFSLLGELSQYTTEIRSANGDDTSMQNVSVKVTKYKVGFIYTFTDNLVKQRAVKDETYSDVIKSLDPYIQERINIAKEQERAEKEAAANPTVVVPESRTTVATVPTGTNSQVLSPRRRR